METKIDKEKLINRSFELSVELAKQINNKQLFITGLNDVNNKIITVTAQSNEVISILRDLGVDDEQLKTEFSKIAKERKFKEEEIKEDAKTEEVKE